MLVVGDLSRLNAVRYPQKPALIMSGIELTYAELNRRSNQLAHALIAQGVVAGDRVALLAFNRLDYAVVTQAVAKCGALLVPMNFRFGPEEIRHVLSDAEPKVMFLEPGFERATLEAIAKGAPPPRLIALTDAPGAQAGTGWIDAPAGTPGGGPSPLGATRPPSAEDLANACPSTDPPRTVDPQS